LAVRLRLRRMGKKKQVHYRLVAADSRFPRDGRFLETVGHFNPRMNPPAAVVNEERVFYWLNNGAEMSEAFRGVLKNKGLLLKYELLKKGTSEAKIDEEMQKWAMSHDLRQQKKAGKVTKTKKKKAKMAAEAATADETTAETTSVVTEEAPTDEKKEVKEKAEEPVAEAQKEEAEKKKPEKKPRKVSAAEKKADDKPKKKAPKKESKTDKEPAKKKKAPAKKPAKPKAKKSKKNDKGGG